ncbi:hypothetical protein [Dyadobacter jiangsuensis]|uniref:hypothetical protein n=1 Tax=Dyadobacter jiangsuensis TaxID=1591085 RepID=UPI0011B26869|nr:hypothetical protein [Dyadobacter jiangsuensis]
MRSISKSYQYYIATRFSLNCFLPFMHIAQWREGLLRADYSQASGRAIPHRPYLITILLS